MSGHALSAPRLNRRQLILGASGATLAVVLWDSREAKATPRPWAGKPQNRKQVEFYSADFSLRNSWQMATTLSITGAASRANEIEVEFTCDSRVLAQRHSMTVERNGKIMTLRAGTHFQTGNESKTNYTLDASVLGSGAVRLGLPLVPRVVYPDDAFDRVALPTAKLTVHDERGAETAFEQPLAIARTSTVAPWTLLPSAGWISLNRADRGIDYRVPAAVTVRSAGPNPIPAGVQLALTVDAAQAGTPILTELMNGGVAMDPTLVDVGTRDIGTTRIVVLTLAQPPVDGEAQTISLSWPDATPHIVAPSPSRASVTILTAGTHTAPRRNIGESECLIDASNGAALAGDVSAMEAR